MLAEGLASPPTVPEAFAHCRRLALAHYENFTIGSWLLPRALRPHMYSIYAYCRGVDDLGDEAEGDRPALLDAWEAELRRCYDGSPSDARFVALRETVRRFDIPPGDYVVPHAGSPAGMKKPEFVEKMKKGPLVLMTIAPGGPPSMSMNLSLWFLYSVVVSVFAAYIAGRAVGPGATYLAVFRFVGAAAFMGYSLALLQNSIWYKRNWGTTLKSMFDGLVYGLLTAGTFGWLWPR